MNLKRYLIIWDSFRSGSRVVGTLHWLCNSVVGRRGRPRLTKAVSCHRSPKPEPALHGIRIVNPPSTVTVSPVM
jgi:hypothetical protein